MIETAKKYFSLAALVAFAFVLVFLQAANSRAAKNPAAQTASESANNAQVPPAKADANGVICFGNELVAQSFAKSATLYDGNRESHNYRVHTLHREAPGEVELHTKDTDIFYILEGSATFVTGGVMADGRDTAPNEVRGKSMQGGIAYHLTKGAVVIIPANVTHWFKEVQQPVTYLTIKVR